MRPHVILAAAAVVLLSSIYARQHVLVAVGDTLYAFALY